MFAFPDVMFFATKVAAGLPSCRVIIIVRATTIVLIENLYYVFGEFGEYGVELLSFDCGLVVGGCGWNSCLSCRMCSSGEIGLSSALEDETRCLVDLLHRMWDTRVMIWVF